MMSAASARQCGRIYASFALTIVSLAAVRSVDAQANEVAKQRSGAPAQLPAFDVVSIKPHGDEGIGHMNADIWMMPDGITVSGIPLSMLIREAFGVSEDRMLNLPAWAESSRYDVQAKVAADDVAAVKMLSPKQRWEMLLPVFEDRFNLKFHHETVDLRAYALTVAKGGAKITAAKPAQPDEDAQPRFKIRGSPQGTTMECHGATMANLAQTISDQLGTTVVDRTELSGNYDFTLVWTPDEGAGPTMTGSAPMTMRMPAAGIPPDPALPREGLGPSLVAALQEQLGLKLESRKLPVDVIVIDHIEQLSPN